MKESQIEDIDFSGRVIAKNTIYNLLGYGLPIIVAVGLIPLLIRGLGDEKFGILNLAWIVVGYFSFFDFGIGRTLTKIIAEKIGLEQTSEIPDLFWTSIFLMMVISCVSTLLVILFTPYLVYHTFNISKNFQSETLLTFYILGLSIPIVTTTAGLRGMLEAYQKFRIINIYRIILGIFTFLGPVLCLIFTNKLYWIIIVLVFIRILIWLFYLIECFKTHTKLKKDFKITPALIKPILKLSGWMTISNVVSPLIIYLDRFLIGSLVSAAAITYYATPYEVVTKLLLIPGAIVTVLFPVFSASFVTNTELTHKIYLRSIKYIFILLFPVILIMLTFSYEGLKLWVGIKIANESSIILKLLALGVLVNSIAYIPFTFLQGIGKPIITGMTQLIELPLYILFMWLAIKYFGVNGAAFVWMIRIFLDAIILFFITHRILKIKHVANSKIYILFFIFLFIPSFINILMVKIVFVFCVLILWVVSTWNYLLKDEEKSYMFHLLGIKGYDSSSK